MVPPPKYLPDTNVLVEVGKNQDYFGRLQNLLAKVRSRIVLAPVVLIELVIGLVNGSEEHFERNKTVFRRIQSLSPEILQLPNAFAQQLLWGRDSGNHPVRPSHYWDLISAINSSKTKAEFFRKANSPSVAWARIEELPNIHKQVVDQELRSLRTIASQRSTKTPGELIAKTFAVEGNKPDPNKVNETFSAAFEYLQSAVAKVRSGSNPEKNDRGLYVDYNLFLYLGDTDIVLITNEKFQKWITKSPQASRIIPPNW